jgi:hypothetical protein
MIREFYSFRACDEDARQLLLEEIVGMVRSQIKPQLRGRLTKGTLLYVSNRNSLIFNTLKLLDFNNACEI